jgi:hypothetical protein
MRRIVTRDVTPEECPWLDSTVLEGTVVYDYHGFTYGCIGSGIAVSFVPEMEPFVELPRDAMKAADLGYKPAELRIKRRLGLPPKIHRYHSINEAIDKAEEVFNTCTFLVTECQVFECGRLMAVFS